MNKSKKEIILSITGASGSIYAIRLINILSEIKEINKINLIISNTAYDIINNEIGKNINEILNNIPNKTKINQFAINDFSAPFASGNSKYDAMIIVPCSMKTLAGIASGFSDNLILRAADVILKERKKLIIVPRETPLNLIHIKNLLKASEAGAIILPAMPAFYFNPDTIQDLVDFIIAKILMQLELNHPIIKQWKK